MTDPLQLPLRDIHLPEDPSWWPPAPGWWIILGLAVLLVMVAWWWQRRQQRIRLSAVNLARQSLDSLQAEYARHQDAQQLVRELSVLLRRLSISAFPRVDSASLTGANWLQFLDRVLNDDVFSNGAGRILIDAPYRREVYVEQVGPLFTLCREWIDAVEKHAGGKAS